MARAAKPRDTVLWENHTEVIGSTGNIYTVAQNKAGRFWGCDCPGWKSRRKCKHLESMGLPGGCMPYELKKNGFTDGYKKASKPGSPNDWAKAIEKHRPEEKIQEKAKRIFDFGDEEEKK